MSDQELRGLLFEMFLDAIAKSTAHQKTFGNTDEVNPDTYANQAMQVINTHTAKLLSEQLDRIELSMQNKIVINTTEGWKEFVRKHVVGAIEKEREKLNE